MEWTKTHTTIALVLIWLEISKRRKKIFWCDFVSIFFFFLFIILRRYRFLIYKFTNSILFKYLWKLVICHWVPLKIVKVAWLRIFSFITTTFHDLLDKPDINKTDPSLHILALTIEFDYPERCKHLSNPELSRVNSSLKLFWLTNIWVASMQFPSHHKKTVKPNQNQSVINRKFNLIFRGKSYGGLRWSRWNAVAHQRLSSTITGVISKLIVVKVKNSLWIIFTGKLSEMDSAESLRKSVLTYI